MSWLLFIPACFALNMAPGPNNITAFATGARLGFWPGFLAALGRLPAFAFLITLTAIGLGAALTASAVAFTVIKYVGAAYLVYVGFHMLRARVDTTDMPAAQDIRSLMRRDFLIAITNPKAIAIFTAVFPQFLDLSQPAAPQFVWIGGTFLCLETVAIAIYVAAGTLLSGVINQTAIGGALNKAVGGFLVFSGAALVLGH
ncbi:LysE family translocator [Breoghania sp.]|uniref:LysE family translocator n=1 Tax=Breoghania sp. TaxID=2065378 RepID=UPI002AAB7083|nr:LysE family translocator [Breoghania sp.]